MPNYLTHQHAQLAGDDSNVVPVSALFDRQDDAAGHGGEIEQVTQTMMRPHQAVKKGDHVRQDEFLCEHEGCRAYPMKTLDYCYGHARSKGLIEPKVKS